MFSLTTQDNEEARQLIQELTIKNLFPWKHSLELRSPKLKLAIL